MRLLQITALAAAVAAVGCGGVEDPELTGTTVRGTVTLDGKPLTTGSVIFATPAYGAKLAGIGPDGTYKITNLPIGNIPVAVTQVVIGQSTKDAPANKKGVPAKYQAPDKSGLTATVGKGETVYDIQLKS